MPAVSYTTPWGRIRTFAGKGSRNVLLLIVVNGRGHELAQVTPFYPSGFEPQPVRVGAVDKTMVLVCADLCDQRRQSVRKALKTYCILATRT